MGDDKEFCIFARFYDENHDVFYELSLGDVHKRPQKEKKLKKNSPKVFGHCSIAVFNIVSIVSVR